uniref:Contactin associated protein family member 5 n=1 Tax=Papio anubis TaxID=9555 RepID=A0A8I5NNJ3_PAPAN
MFLSASLSLFSTQHTPGTGGWSPADSNAQQWLQMDLGNRVEITAVATQGRYGSSDWVTSYSLMFSDTGRNWKQYKQEDSIWTFAGNMNADSVVHHKLLHSVRARFVRFVPLEWNPSGKIGMRVEVYGCSYKSDVADFDGRSSLLYRFNQKLMSTLKDVISLKFKSMQGDGVLFHGEGQRGDHITLELQKGRLSLHLNLGRLRLPLPISSLPSATLGSLLDDQHWHSVLIERVGKQVNFTVDKHTQHFRTKGETDALDIDYELSFGGIPVPGKPGTFLKKNFHGCIENLYYNGVNIIDLAKRRKHQIYTVVSQPISTNILCVLSSHSCCLLLPFDQSDIRITCLYSVCSSYAGKIILKYGSIANQYLLLTEAVGYEAFLLSPFCQLIWFFSFMFSFIRCLPNYCEHGGSCSQSWTTFYCNCSDTSYTGATCHNSIYEQSCEVYRHQGNTAGFFYIDSDGSGPLGPLQVYCNITEDKIWTSVQHNNTELTRVRGANAEKPYAMALDYGGSMEQLEAVIDGSEHCEQEVAYHCRRSRLLNTPDGTPFTWWIGRSNERHPYWGGSPPGVQQCECGLDESCLDIQHFCNCDADKDEWTNDTGFLSFKDHLPVTQIVITDTDRSNSEAAWRIGPLRCYGDRRFWNAVSFYTEASYLHFPTFHAEFSADISFFFKTTALSGVFLENLGIKDFIRLEISSPSEITFAIDVGNGPVELVVQSPSLLNDNQWHYVRAERNLKETSLQVDNLPRSTRETSEEGHFRLQLNSQLFVGGTSSRQKGFLGCIRSLHLNGQKLDLEERAKVTSGVRPGCPGHCSSYGSICHNGGKCVEKHNGYLCDCTNSPYEGPFCKKEVSAVFEAGTSVTYMFQEPYPVTKNISLSSSAIYTDSAPSKENIAFSFVTAQTPSLLLFVNSSSQDFLAVLLCKNGSLQVRYHLNKEETHVFTIDADNFANRRMHHLKINREGRELTIQVPSLLSPVSATVKGLLIVFYIAENLSLDSEVAKANALGFAGCLSSVQYNHIAPLKAALRHATVAPVTVHGTLMESSCDFMVDSDVDAVTTVHSSSGILKSTHKRASVTGTTFGVFKKLPDERAASWFSN